MLAKCDSPIFIIGSASTGTSMLSSILSRHSDILIGPEMFLFNKQDIYKNYNYVKTNINKWLKKGLLTQGQINQKVFFFNKAFYDLNDQKITKIFNDNDSLRNCIDTIFYDLLKKEKKTIWGEKTGSNSYCMQNILEMYPNARIIHMVRDPFDTIVSIAKRNSNIFHATSHYLYNNVASLRFSTLNNYLQIKYELLVTNPDKELKNILNFLNVKHIDLLSITSSYWNQVIKFNGNSHKSWNNTPLRNPNPSSIGKGRKELTKEDLRIIKSMELNKNAKQLLNLDLNIQYTIKFLSNELSYNTDWLTNITNVSIRKNIAREYFEAIKRTKYFFSVKPIVKQYNGNPTKIRAGFK